MKQKKKCKHFRGEIPGYESDELRIADKEPCEVCDVKDRMVKVGETTVYIPKFTLVGK